MKQRVNVPFWLPLIFFHLLSNCTLYLLGTLSAPGTPYQRPCNLVARLFCFPLLTYPTRDKPPSHFPKSHPSKFRLPPLPAQYRLRTPFPTGSSLYPAQNTASAGPISPQRFPCLYKHKKTGGLKRPPAKVNNRKTVYYR